MCWRSIARVVHGLAVRGTAIAVGGTGDRRLATIVVYVWLACLVAPATSTGAEGPAQDVERQIKAAFLSKFAGYVEWPESAFAAADTPISVAVIGDEPIAGELKALLAGKRLDDRAFEVHTLREGESTRGVHILFVPKSRRSALEAGLASPGQPTLVVAEWDDALAHGATINFVVVGDHVRFDVSLANAEQHHLKLGSRLLSVARTIVRPD
jgi:hypothetical protein